MTVKINAIITHSGSFHADEIAAITLLKQYYLEEPVLVADHLLKDEIIAIVSGETELKDNMGERIIPIIRTRDKEILEAARNCPETFVIDVGGEYSSLSRNFDHHQRSMDKKWDDGTPFSSAGLIWEWLKEKGVLHTNLDEEVIQELEKKLIIPLDSTDNGLKLFEPALLCEQYNRSSDFKVTTKQFIKALDYMENFFSNNTYEITMEINARYMVEEAIKKAPPEQNYVVFDEKPSGNKVAIMVKELSNNKIVMFGVPGGGSQYSLISVPKDVENPFSIQNPWPEEMRGKMDFEIKPENGTPIKIKFVHKSGFMGVIEGSKEDCEKIARMITSEVKPQLKPIKLKP